MVPVRFPQANSVFHHPKELHEVQCRSVDAYCGKIDGGSLDGEHVVVVAWQPTEDELKRLNAGGPVFLSCVGGLIPHFLCTTYEEAINVA